MRLRLRIFCDKKVTTGKKVITKWVQTCFTRYYHSAGQAITICPFCSLVKSLVDMMRGRNDQKKAKVKGKKGNDEH